MKGHFYQRLRDGSLQVELAQRDGEVIGTAGVCYFQYPPSFLNPSGRIAYVTNVYTKEAFRHQGIATQLVKKIVDEIKKSGVEFARLHSSEQGRALYEAFGFSSMDGFMSKKM